MINQIKFPNIGIQMLLSQMLSLYKGWNVPKFRQTALDLTTSILLHQSLTWFIQEVGILNLVVSDDSNAQVAGEFGKIASYQKDVNHAL
jgi:hypothetical protein